MIAPSSIALLVKAARSISYRSICLAWSSLNDLSRFIDSTHAYQGAAGGLDPAVLTALERVVVGRTRPDLTLILDLPPETGLARAAARGEAVGQGPDRFEGEALGFHTRLRAAFLEIAKAEPGRCAVIDATSGPDAVEAAIRGELDRRGHMGRGLPGQLTCA